MNLVLSQEQRLLKDTARDFLSSHAPVAALRALRDARDPLGYSLELWQQMTGMGWPAMLVPEEFGGMAFGFAGMAALLEETGRTLTASPLLSTAVLGVSALVLGGNQDLQQSLLPRICTGQLRLALALEESHRHAPLDVQLRAEACSGGFRLTGRKQFVIDGYQADGYVAVARSAGAAGDSAGISLFYIDAGTVGLQARPIHLMDSRNAALLDLHGVELARDCLLGEQDAGYPLLDAVLDRGRVALAAEMLGGILESFERTVDYLKQREQFGVKIGSFQALQHRAAQLFTEIELCKSVVLDAAIAADEQPARLPLAASLAKAKLNDSFERVSNEAVQMHGGIGTTDALDIGLFLKRARVAMQFLGDSRFHRDRYARLRGF